MQIKSPVNGQAPASEPDLSTYAVPPAPPPITQEWDLNAYRATPAPTVEPLKTEVKTVRVDKPRLSEFIYIHPEWRACYWILPADFKAKRDAYMVLPDVAENLQPLCKKVLLVPYCDSSGNYYLWPIAQEDTAGRLNDWSKTLMPTIEQAAGHWCRFQSNMKKSRYDVYDSNDPPEAPQWPFKNADDMTLKAFTERVIPTADHPVLQSAVGKKR